MRSATIGKSVSEAAVPSSEESAGAFLRVWISAVREERLPATFSSKTLSRSITAAKRSGVGAEAGSDGELSFAARVRGLEVEAGLLVAVRLGVVGDDTALVFVMYILSCLAGILHHIFETTNDPANRYSAVTVSW
jgi:hypothetical protein